MESSTAQATKPEISRGEEGLWVFIFGDLTLFAVFFVIYAIYRAESPALFQTCQIELSRPIGMLNTVLLLTSSLFFAQAVHQASQGLRHVRTFLGLSMLLGLAFCVTKFFEWSDKFAHGLSVKTNLFFTFYFMYTGIHLVHVVVGLLLMTYVLKFHAIDEIKPASIVTMRSVGIYWHMVDLLWVVIFSLLYLVR